MLPEFLLPGVQKSGTSSLFKYLVQHPGIRKPFVKELHFFTRTYNPSPTTYRKYFPLHAEHFFRTRLLHQKFITGEATPDYFFHPLSPQRIQEVVPQVKIILLFRDPVARAYSHYQHLTRYKFTDLSFQDALRKEQEVLQEEWRKVQADESYWSPQLMRYSILNRGQYITHLRYWLRFFPMEQFLILRSKDLYNQPKEVYRQVLEFLELPEWYPRKFKKYNQNPYKGLDKGLQRELQEYYRPYNKELEEFLGRKFGWDD